jgi:hypothetical protein
MEYVDFTQGPTARIMDNWREYVMASTRKMGLGAALVAAVLTLSSCSSSTVYHTAGSQCRDLGNKQVCGYDLSYDSSVRLYRVVGLNDHYYGEGFFYRLRGGIWEISVQTAEWRAVQAEMLPSGLKARVKSAAKANGKGLVQAGTRSALAFNDAP